MEPQTQQDGSTGASSEGQNPPKLPDGIIEKDGQFFVQTKVDGAVKEVPFSEAQIRLQKEVAAEKRLQEAAELRKELESEKEAHKQALRYWELSKKALYQNDPDAGRQALDVIGYEVPEDADTPEGNPGSGKEAPQIDWSQAPTELQEAGQFMRQMKEMGIDPTEAMATVRDATAQQIRAAVFEEAGNAALTDPALRQILTKKDARAKRVRNRLQTLVAEKMRAGDPRGAQTYAQVVREIKAELQDLGTLGKEGQLVSPATSPLPGFPGMGPATGGVGGASAVRPAERPRPTSPYKGGGNAYAKNLLERWAFDLTESGG